MTREQLYDKAFEFKKTKLWKKLYESDLFSVMLDSGDIAYVSVKGRYAGHEGYQGLAIYIGDEGFHSYDLMTRPDFLTASEFKRYELIFGQKALHVSFTDKESLSGDELTEVRDYAKRHNVQLKGVNAYPRFEKHEPGYYPWKIVTDDDMRAVYTCLEAAILLAKKLENSDPASLGIKDVYYEKEKAPLFILKNNELKKSGSVVLPVNNDEHCIYIKFKDTELINRIRNLEKRGIMEAQLIRVPEAVYDKTEEIPYYQLAMLMVDNRDGKVVPIKTFGGVHPAPQKMIREIADGIIQYGIKPEEIRCYDNRTYGVLEDLCKKTGIKVFVCINGLDALKDFTDYYFKEIRYLE